MTATCFIMLAANVGGLGMLTDTEISGKIVRDDGYYYTIDFSEEASMVGLSPDSAVKKVKKTDCIKGQQ